MDRIIGAGRAAFEDQFCEFMLGRIPVQATVRLLGLLGLLDDGGEERGVLAELKSDPGRLGLETLVNEISKLDRVLALGLPSDLFADVSEKLVASWRARAAAASPSRLREISEPVRITLLAALCWSRTAEITDNLVDLLIGLGRKINTRAERRVEGELVKDVRRVHGKDRLLFRIAEASVANPDSSVRSVVFPIVNEATLRDLVREAKATSEVIYRQHVRTVLSSSYSSHYRRMLPGLLAALDFRCGNTEYQPVIDAVRLLRRYSDQPAKVKHFDPVETVPLEAIVPREWRAAVGYGRPGRVRVMCPACSARESSKA